VTDPYELLNATGQQLANVVGTTVRATQNANKVGKDGSTWSSCYLVVDAALSSTMKQEADKRIQELESDRGPEAPEARVTVTDGARGATQRLGPMWERTWDERRRES